MLHLDNFLITSLIFVYFSDILAIEIHIWLRKHGKLLENKARPRFDFILAGMSYIAKSVCKIKAGLFYHASQDKSISPWILCTTCSL